MLQAARAGCEVHRAQRGPPKVVGGGAVNDVEGVVGAGAAAPRRRLFCEAAGGELGEDPVDEGPQTACGAARERGGKSAEIGTEDGGLVGFQAGVL